MNNTLKRLKAEENELNDKIIMLKNFVRAYGTDELIKAQEKAMNDYFQILAMRILQLEEKGNE
jgi:uncharacterized protein YlxW (UPF0749 family)